MGDNVVRLVPRDDAEKRQPIPEIVAYLRDMLQRAEAGDVRAVAGVFLVDDGNETRFRSIGHAPLEAHAVIGHLQVLSAHMANAIIMRSLQS